ncbi:translation initiation factor IF-2-like [Gallus gallus]|uniref:translation initiation factor IF-2-like n=1 Tax=Gallus gallus TaxID=9031 RepID=UPI001F02B7D3|nr:translation initiation factor IF-2-like [Gallus gallus]XP_046795340.1 translation initiation factor IF-2-like [Gallus gallus]
MAGRTAALSRDQGQVWERGSGTPCGSPRVAAAVTLDYFAFALATPSECIYFLARASNGKQGRGAAGEGEAAGTPEGDPDPGGADPEQKPPPRTYTIIPAGAPRRGQRRDPRLPQPPALPAGGTTIPAHARRRHRPPHQPCYCALPARPAAARAPSSSGSGGRRPSRASSSSSSAAEAEEPARRPPRMGRGGDGSGAERAARLSAGSGWAAAALAMGRAAASLPPAAPRPRPSLPPGRLPACLPLSSLARCAQPSPPPAAAPPLVQEMRKRQSHWERALAQALN